MPVVVENANEPLPQPLAAHTTGGSKTRILLVDNEPPELEKLRNALAAEHREITIIQASDVETAFKAFDGHDIVVTDRRLKETGVGWEGVDLTAQIKAARPETVVILNSAFPMGLTEGLEGDPSLWPDYSHVKGMGIIHKKGEQAPIVRPEKADDRYVNLAELVRQIEQNQLKLTQT